MRTLSGRCHTFLALAGLLLFAACSNHPWFRDDDWAEQIHRRAEQKNREAHREWLKQELLKGKQQCHSHFQANPNAVRDIYRITSSASPSAGADLRQCLNYGGVRFVACVRSIPGSEVGQQQCAQSPIAGCRALDVAIAALARSEEVAVPAWSYPDWSPCALPEGWAVVPERGVQEELADEAAARQQAEAAQQHLQAKQQCLAQCESSRGLCDNGCLTRFPQAWPESIQRASARTDCSRSCFGSYAGCRSQCP